MGWGKLRSGFKEAVSKEAVSPSAVYAPVPTSEARGVHTVPEILVHYDSLDIDEDLQMPPELRDELGELWVRGSKGAASQLVNSFPMALVISTIVAVDILVAINLEPNPAEGYQSSWFDNFAYILDVVATSLFSAEAALRMHAMSLRGYFQCGFNQLDMLVVLSSWCSILFESFSIDLGPLRAFRVLRVLKEIRFLNSLQAIMVRH